MVHGAWLKGSSGELEKYSSVCLLEEECLISFISCTVEWGQVKDLGQEVVSVGWFTSNQSCWTGGCTLPPLCRAGSSAAS